MNRLILGLLPLVAFSTVQAQVFKVQGVPHKGVVMHAAGYDEDPVKADPNFDFSQIKSWAGEGSNECAVVIQWSLPEEENAIVFGYRWDGDASGEDALVAVVKANPQLYGSFTHDGQYGATLNGLGWDQDNDGNFSVTTGAGRILYPDAEGMISSSAAELDGSSPTNANDYFRGGWFEGYWTYYWGNMGETSFEYSQVGMTGRQLKNGCIDAWIFAPDMEAQPLKTWIAAESQTPDQGGNDDPNANETIGEISGDYSVGDVFEYNGVKYRVISKGDANELSITYNAVTAPDDYWANGNYYIGDYNIPSIIKISGTPYTVASVDEYAFNWAKNLGKVHLPETIRQIGKYAFNCSGLTEINVPDNVEVIEEESFYKCESLKTLNGMKGVKTIQRAAFLTCSALNYIESLESVEHIADFAFIGCSAITELPPMPYVKTIDNEAFSGCNSLKYIALPATIEEDGIGTMLGGNISGDIVIYSCMTEPKGLKYFHSLGTNNSPQEFAPVYVPYGTTALYKSTKNWNRSEIREISPIASVSLMSEKINGNTAEFRLSLKLEDGIVEEDVPLQFIEANDFTSHPAKVAQNMHFEFRPLSLAREAEASTTIKASVDNGEAVVKLENAKAGDYEYRWVSGLPSQKADTEWRQFTLESNGSITTNYATFNFADVASLNPAPTDSDWGDEYGIMTRWVCAGTDFSNNGVHLSFTNGADVAHRSLIFNNNGSTELDLMNTLTISAPAGRTISSVRLQGIPGILGTNIRNVGLAENQPGSLKYTTNMNGPSFAVWTAPESDKVSNIVFKTTTPETNIRISDISVELHNVDTSVGVEMIELENEVEYYTIDGIKVKNPKYGVYIERSGVKSRKVIL